MALRECLSSGYAKRPAFLSCREGRQRLLVRAQAAPPTVVVSGASSGIGKATAVCLASKGWKVFAGCRSDEAADELAALHSSIQPIQLDVTSTQSVREAAQAVRQAVGTTGVQGLVNNAGFGIFLPVECFPEDAWASVMDVNVTGALRCTQAFLPLLRAGEERGRIVNMSSIAGSISLPLFGAYSASKHALEAMSDALRFELNGQGIYVSIVKPGPVVTNIWDRARKGSTVTHIGGEEQKLYGHLIDKTLNLTLESEKDGIPADDVAAVVLEALTARRPRTRYVVGKGAPVVHLLRRLLPDSLFDRMINSYYR